MFILLPTTKIIRPAFSHDNPSEEMSRYSGKSEYDHSQSSAVRAETEHYVSPEPPLASFRGVHHTTACSTIVARTSVSHSPAGAASETQKHSPVSTKGLANAQHSCPYDSFSALAAEVSSKTIVLRKEVSPDVSPDRRGRQLNNSVAPSTSKQEGSEGISTAETKCYSAFGTGS